MASEKIFENKIKKVLKNNNAWSIKYWAGAMFTKSGIPDLLICANGYFTAIEVKAETGTPSELQKYNISLINKSGGYAIILKPSQYELFEMLLTALNKNKTEEARKKVNEINEVWKL